MNRGIGKKQKHYINGENKIRNKDDGENVKLEINFRCTKAQTESLKPSLRNIFIYHLINPLYPALIKFVTLIL
jgi:hypothetical protein